MSYTLISTEYIPAEGEAQLVQGIKGNRVPRGAIKGGNGTFVVRGGYIPAEFRFYFADTTGKKYCYEAYKTIKSSMETTRLTEARRSKIREEVAVIAKESNNYNPEEWIEKAVRKLKI